MAWTASSWWETDTYDIESALPPQKVMYGPRGAALVKVFGEGSTQTGWGGGDFMEHYGQGDFLSRRAEWRFQNTGEPFALVMRSAQLVCIDIDGKNGGFEHVKKLGLLPPTLAERSKSGNGYHLFYSTDEEWDDKEGFAGATDHVGIVTGVDIRSVGCVYHYAQQRWNDRPVAPIPDWFWEKTTEKKRRRDAAATSITGVLAGKDQEEILIMQDALELELNKPIPQGKRNTTLFAIGSQMKLAEIDEWDVKIEKRGLDIGLSVDETTKIIENIERYA